MTCHICKGPSTDPMRLTGMGEAHERCFKEAYGLGDAMKDVKQTVPKTDEDGESEPEKAKRPRKPRNLAQTVAYFHRLLSVFPKDQARAAAAMLLAMQPTE